MDTQELVSYLDELLFSSTGERIDSLQVAILKGVLKGQKYADIAQEFNCSAGHAKDEAYKLWQTLSDALGEEVNKSNFCATVQPHIPQVLLVVLQIICTLHKWCSSLIRITSNGVVQMYYSICGVNLRNVGSTIRSCKF